jgi:hypothetical protein
LQVCSDDTELFSISFGRRIMVAFYMESTGVSFLSDLKERKRKILRVPTHSSSVRNAWMLFSAASYPGSVIKYDVLKKKSVIKKLPSSRI